MKYLIMHHNDLDGRSAGYFASKCIPVGHRDNIKFIELNYSNNDTIKKYTIDKDTIVYIVDCSFTKPTVHILNEMIRTAKEVIWIDHHQSSIDVLAQGLVSPGFKGIINTNRSGAYLTYLWMLKTNGRLYGEIEDNLDLNSVPMFVKYIDDYDRWVMNYTESKLFKYAYESEIDQSPTSFIWSELELQNHNKLNDMIKSGQYIEKYNLSRNKEAFNSLAYESIISGYKCIVINGYGNSDLLCDALEKYPCGIVWKFDGENYVYSIYSDKNSEVNCQKIAEGFGGGGHPHASGFRTKDLIIRKL